MQFTTSFVTIASLYAAAGVLSSPAPSSSVKSASAAELECGHLGVMNATGLLELPEGVDPSAVRTCLEHPAGSSVESKLRERTCYYDAPFGCSKGYCWKQCGSTGDGKWCWTAFNGGYGQWIGCSIGDQCSQDQACGAGGCKDCGCSC